MKTRKKERGKQIIKEGNLLKIGKEWYAPNWLQEREGKLSFHKVDRKKYNVLVNSIIKKCLSSMNPKEILKDSLFSLDEDTLKKIYENLYKKKFKPKARRGCFEITVGDERIPIRE